MSTITAVTGARTLLTDTALDSLASATYVSAGVIDMSAVNPLDLIIEVSATPGTVGDKRQLQVFARASLDGTVYSTGPVSGTTITDEPNLRQLGSLPLNTNATLQRSHFSVAGTLGYVPPYVEIVVKNETGAALASSGQAVHYAPVVGHTA